jgi:uncharacterized protein YcbK (DUF882 family)
MPQESELSCGMPLHRPRVRLGGVVLGAVGFLCAFTLAARAHADRQHTVRSGQSLGQIAKRYRVGISDLAAANGLSRNELLRDGQVLSVPPEGVVIVASGQTLGSIAKAHAVPLAALAKANKLRLNEPIQVGQRLTLPGAKPRRKEKESRWGKPKRPGVVTFHRIWSNETMRVRILDDKGKVRRGAVRRMRDIMRPRVSRKRKPPNERLLRLLAQVSDHFGGRPLHIVSGYRLPGGLTRDTSRHVAGEAIDFRILGVPLQELRDRCHKFAHVGVGYYPRTQFVHLDVRRQNARWTDWSLPGQSPVLQKPDDVDDLGNPVAPEPILPASEGDLQEAPPAADDGQPPIDDSPPEPDHRR